MKICLIGPCSPLDIDHGLFEFRPDNYDYLDFYRGIPVSTLANELLAAGHEIEIISTAYNLVEEQIILSGPRLKFTIVRSTKNTKVRALTLWKSDRKLLVTAIKKSDADIFHAHWTYEFAMATLTCKRDALISAHDAPIKILQHYRDIYRLLRLVMAFYVRFRTRNLAVVSPYLADSWRTKMHWKKNIFVLPNLIPKDIVIGNHRYSPHGNRVLCVSDASELKNVKTLIRSWNQMSHLADNSLLVIVGHGLGPGEEMFQWADSRGLNNRIVWKGYLERKEISAEMSRANILCHPSLEESHSLALLEALTMGLPIIAGKNSGAVPWVVGDAGVLVDVASESDLSEAIIKLLQNLEARVSLSKMAAKRSFEVFGTQVILPKYLDTYRLLVG
jgi:glycosyltransferase involved in cell wall biosynthesis